MSQVAIGALLPGNDVDRAFAFLELDDPAKAAALAGAALGMAAAGAALARCWPRSAASPDRPDRALIIEIAIPATLAVALLIPFRVPRGLVEVMLVPVIVHLLGVGWTLLGGVRARGSLRSPPSAGPRLLAPAAALLALLAVFQLVLARGIAL